MRARCSLTVLAGWILSLTGSASAQVQFRWFPENLIGKTAAGISMAVGDIDGDGDVDVVGGTTIVGQTHMWLNDAHGRLVLSKRWIQQPLLNDTLAPTLFDADGDGDLDLLTGGNSIRKGRPGYDPIPLRMYLNDGKGGFTDMTALRLPKISARIPEMSPADVDGDGDLDVFVAVSGSPNLLLINNGKGSFKDEAATRFPKLPSLSGDTSSCPVADVDADGDVDVLFTVGGFMSQGKGSTVLLLNDGKGKFVSAGGIRLPLTPLEASQGIFHDVDGDKDPDLVLATYVENRLLVNDGKGAFSDVTKKAFPRRTDLAESVVAGDFDEDGDIDLVFTGFWMKTVRYGRAVLYRNVGFMRFAVELLPLSGPGNLWMTGHRLHGVDLDADGDRDLMVVPMGGILINVERQLQPPKTATLGTKPTLWFWNAEGSRLALPFVALAQARIDLPGVTGRLRLDPASFPLNIGVFPLPANKGWGLPVGIPNDARLRGLTVFTQALILDPRRIRPPGFTNQEPTVLR